MVNTLWTGADVISALGGRLVGPLPGSVTGVSIDSRTCENGNIFFAIAGDNHDGHGFVRAALGNGAAMAVIAEEKLPELVGAGSLVVVNDVLEAMRNLARAARNRSQAGIVAVTGSVGKTSTKDMLRLVLGKEKNTHASVASYNNHWGVPLTLARLPQAAEYAVFEIGMNHAGEIVPLVDMVKPHVGIITTVEPVHLEFFENVEAIADAKAEIFTGIAERGYAVLNADNPHFERLKAQAENLGVTVKSFGVAPQADARLLTIAALPECSVVTVSVLGKELAYKLGAPGRHLAQNSLAVLLSVALLGGDVGAAARALNDFKATKGRGERQVIATEHGNITLLDESYNANPASMRAALALLNAAPVGGHRIAVLGDMLELGEQSEALHRDIAPVIESLKIDTVFAAGEKMKALYDALPDDRKGAWAATSAELLPSVLNTLNIGDTVMVKGSLGSKMGLIVDAIKAMEAVNRKIG